MLNLSPVIAYYHDHGVGWFSIFASSVVGWLIGVAYTEFRNHHGRLYMMLHLEGDLRETLLKNRGYIDHMYQILDTETKGGKILLPNFLLDPAILESITLNNRKFFKSAELFDAVNLCRYKMGHVNNVLTTTMGSSEQRKACLRGLLEECRKEICVALHEI